MTRLVFFLSAMLLAVQMHGAVIVLKNGDRVSGVIVSREGGVIQLESGLLGTLRIPQAQVERIEEEVPGEAGVAAKPAGSAAPEVPVIQKQGDNVGTASEEIAEAAAASGVEEKELNEAVQATKTERTLEEAIFAVPVLGDGLEWLSETGWVRDWKSSLSVGANALLGRSVARSFNYAFWTERKKKKYEIRIENGWDYEVTITEDSKGNEIRKPTRDKARGLFRYRYNLGEAIFLQSNTQYSNSRTASIDHDLRESLGLGWRFFDSKRLQGNVTPSLTAQYQVKDGVSPDGWSLAPTLYQELVYNLNERITFRQEANALFPIEDESEPTYGVLIRMETKLIKSLSFNIEYDYDYDGGTAPGINPEQTSIRTRLGVTF